MRNWEIKSRNRFCSSCDGAFEIEQLFHTVLDFTGEEPVRKDYCLRCWKEKDLEAGKAGKGRAYWQGRFKRLAAAVEKEAIKKDVIERLLDRYIRSEKEAHINLCYILALLEERKKVLIPRDTMLDKEGRSIIVYEHAATGDTYLIRDPHLSLVQVEAVQEQVKELIDREKEGAEGGEGEVEEDEDEETASGQ
jgi:hypothetical protein